jgi:hypothetical protein
MGRCDSIGKRRPSPCAEHLRGAGENSYCSRRIQLRNTGRLSRDECAGENQLCARRARIRETAPCAKESLFDDGAKDSIANRRVRSRIIRALELHGHYLAPAPGAVMSTAPHNADILFATRNHGLCQSRSEAYCVADHRYAQCAYNRSGSYAVANGAAK